MDESNLINFNNENCVKLASPLIPLPVDPQQKYRPRLSDAENNPFDKVFRKTMRKNDPFECACEDSFVKNDLSSEDKENIPHLISPYMTPVAKKKQIKICTTPLYLNENTPPKTPILRKDLNHVMTKLNYSKNNNDDINNSSLQILSDSISDNLNCCFIASDIELSNEDSKNFVEDGNNSHSIPEICVNDENTYIYNRTNRIKSKSSVISENIVSFNSDSLMSEDISNIPNFTSCSSKSQSVFDKGFVADTLSSEIEKSLEFRRRCMSANRPSKPEFGMKNFTAKRQLNNSFSDFHHNEWDNTDNKTDDILKHDSVFVEEQKMKSKGDASYILAALDAEDMIDASLPPWMEENLNVSSETSDCEEEIADNNFDSIDKIKKEPEIQIEEIEEKYIKQELENSYTEPNHSRDEVLEINTNEINKNDTKQEFSENEVEKAKNFLQNISDILQSDGKRVDRKKLGESLINSIALALNLDNSMSINDNSKSKQDFEQICDKKVDCKAETSKPIKSKSKMSCIKKIETKIKVQAMKFSSSEKNLKVKNEKEKNNVKGPLKAVIPVKNMAKTKKSIVPRLTFGGTFTPPKVFQIKKTSTPNENKLKSPMAQSTPNTTKPTCQGATTPTRTLSYIRSSLPRPSSTNDINKSISPKYSSTLNSSIGSVQNVSQEKPANRSIPLPGNFSMLRRKSASDLKDNNNLQRSYEVEKVSKPSKLKRSISFQSKYLKT